MKIIMLTTTSQSVISFRKKLIEALVVNGHNLLIISGDNERKTEIEKLGVGFIEIGINNRSLNPFKNQKYKKELFKIINKEIPDIVLTFMAKPNTLGVFAAKKAGVKNIFCTVEGLGSVFTNKNLKTRLARIVLKYLYKKAFKTAAKIFFLNPDDKQVFLKNGIVKEEKVVLLNGIGVDLERFPFIPIKSYNTFLMVARLLPEKGVMEYCDAAKIIKNKFPHARFLLAGGESVLTKKDINQYVEKGIVEYLGQVEDMPSLYRDCSVFVLPSYREGLPMSTMEAMSTGRAVISTNVPGCRETVIDGVNGFLAEAKSVESLSQKMEILIDNLEAQERMGHESRKIAEQKFDEKIINPKIICELENFCKNSINVF